MKAYLNEVLRFFKKYFRNILIGGLVLGLLFGGVLYNRTQNNDEPAEELEIELSGEQLVNQVEPAYFQFYIVQPNGNTFTNFPVINDVFNLESVTEEALEATGINIKRIEEIVKNRNLEENTPGDSEEYNVVEVTKDDSSNVMTAIFDSGNVYNNLSLANYYYDFLFNEELDILSENKLYSIVEPKLVEFPDESEVSGGEGQESRDQTASFSLIGAIVNFIIGVIFSFILLSVIFLIKELFSNKLNYAFTYDRGKQENFLIYNNSINSPELINYFIGLPYSKDKIILSENKLEENSFLEDNVELNIIKNNYQSMLNVNNLSNIEEIVIIVTANETTREWYEKQFELSKMKNIRIKIIQINKSNE